MYKQEIKVEVKEEVLGFKDMYDDFSETHFTQDYVDLLVNTYVIDVDVDEDGNILNSDAQVSKKVEDVAEGIVLEYNLLY